MQLSFDSRGNFVPTILLLMQKRLYAQGGLQVRTLPLFIFISFLLLSGKVQNFQLISSKSRNTTLFNCQLLLMLDFSCSILMQLQDRINVSYFSIELSIELKMYRQKGSLELMLKMAKRSMLETS